MMRGEKILKEIFVVKLKYCPGIWLGWLSKATKCISWVILCPGRDLNSSSSEYTTEPSPLEPAGFVLRKGTYCQNVMRYTGCPRRNVPDFRRVFLMLRYTDITQNTYIKSWTVTEIMAWEKWGLLAIPNTETCTADASRDSVDDLESGMQC